MSRNLFIVVVGCGRLGSHLANRLSRSGHSLVVIDVDETAFQNLDAEFSGFRVEGDATELAILKQARIDHADVVVAVTREDNVNLMVAQVARTVFSVKRVLARVFDPRREQAYRALGVQSICPTLVAADLFLNSLGPDLPSDTGVQQ